MIKKASAFAENFYYKFGIPHTCSYCGDLAETIDHCIPWSVVKRNDNQRRNLIGFCCPACQDCQNILGNRVFSAFQDRVLFVKGKLKNRYGKGHPVWDEEELSELSGNLRKYVEGENYKFNLSRSRILWTNTNEFRKLISEVEEDLSFLKSPQNSKNSSSTTCKIWRGFPRHKIKPQNACTGLKSALALILNKE